MSHSSIRAVIAALLIAVLSLPAAGSALALTVEELEEQIKQKQKEIEELQKEADQYQETIHKHEEEATTLQSYITAYNRQISGLQSEVNLTTRQIESTRLKIEQTNTEIQEKEDLMDRRRGQMGSLVKTVQQTNDTSFIQVMLKNENLSDFFNAVQARTVVQEELQRNLEELRLVRVQLEEKRTELEGEQRQLDEQRAQLAAQQQVLANERSRQATLLNQTQESQAGFEAALADVQSKQKAVNEQIFELEEKLRAELDPNYVPSGNFSYPAEGILTQGYGCVKSWNNAYAQGNCAAGYDFHNGLDIAAKLGTPIRAAGEGTVVAVSNAPYAYGLWVAVRHPNGIVTMYGHMSAQAASVGQNVSRGEVIGYMGSTGFSTGSHVHFTMYAPGTFRVVPSSLSGYLPIGATINPFEHLK